VCLYGDDVASCCRATTSLNCRDDPAGARACALWRRRATCNRLERTDAAKVLQYVAEHVIKIGARQVYLQGTRSQCCVNIMEYCDTSNDVTLSMLLFSRMCIHVYTLCLENRTAVIFTNNSNSTNMAPVIFLEKKIAVCYFYSAFCNKTAEVSRGDQSKG